MSDIKTSLRSFGRTPLIAVASILTIAIAIAGTTSVFALLDAAVLRSLPYEDSDRLVAVWTDVTELADEVGIQDPLREWTNLDTHRDLRGATTTLEDVAVFSGWTPSFRADEGTVRISGVKMTWNGLDLLGVRPVGGRLFTEAEGSVGEPCTVVISERFWLHHFASNPTILGDEVTFTDEVCTVIGVVPSSFRFPFTPTAEIFTPLRGDGNDRGNAYLRQFGRLAASSALDEAQAELDTLAASLRSQYPAAYRGKGFFVEPLQDALNRGVRGQLAVLQAAAIFVLVIAIANLASLVVARVLARAVEFDVRSFLGATRSRQFRLLWVESALIVTAGVAAGIVMTLGSVDLLTRALPQGFDDAWDVQVGVRVFAVAAGAALLAATCMACAGYVALTRTVRRRTGKHGTARTIGDRVGGRVTAGLVASNFAVALAVAVTGVLLLESYQRLSLVDVGFRTDGVTAGMVGLPPGRYPDASALVGAYDRLAERVAQIPGIEASGLASTVPLGVSNNDTFVLIDGHPTAREDGRAHAWLTRVDEGYVDAMGLRIRDGRAFETGDRVGGRAVAIVNTTFVRSYLAGERAIGTRVGLGSGDDVRWFEIVGVANDVRFFDLAIPESPAIYLPAWPVPSRGMYIVVRSERDPLAVIADLRRTVSMFDSTLALVDVQSTRARVAERLMLPRTISRLTLVFALTALLIAAIGVYASLTQSVVRRTRELGVRRALGAQDREVMLQVLRQGLAPVSIGLAAGVPLALFLGSRLSMMLYEVSPREPKVWIITFTTLLLVAVVAAFLPGRNAVRVSPMQALRDE